MSPLWRRRSTRVKFLRGYASLDGTFNVGDVAELEEAHAKADIARGFAVETDEPIGVAPTTISMVPCRHCGAENGEFISLCETCGRRPS